MILTESIQTRKQLVLLEKQKELLSELLRETIGGATQTRTGDKGFAGINLVPCSPCAAITSLSMALQNVPNMYQSQHSIDFPVFCDTHFLTASTGN